MNEEQIQAATKAYEAKLRAWVASQVSQTDGYEYEKSFLEFSREAARETFQLSVGEVPKSKNKKKSNK